MHEFLRTRANQIGGGGASWAGSVRIEDKTEQQPEPPGGVKLDDRSRPEF